MLGLATAVGLCRGCVDYLDANYGKAMEDAGDGLDGRSAADAAALRDAHVPSGDATAGRDAGATDGATTDAATDASTVDGATDAGTTDSAAASDAPSNGIQFHGMSISNNLVTSWRSLEKPAGVQDDDVLLVGLLYGDASGDAGVIPVLGQDWKPIAPFFIPPDKACLYMFSNYAKNVTWPLTWALTYTDNQAAVSNAGTAWVMAFGGVSMLSGETGASTPLDSEGGAWPSPLFKSVESGDVVVATFGGNVAGAPPYAPTLWSLSPAADAGPASLLEWTQQESIWDQQRRTAVVGYTVVTTPGTSVEVVAHATGPYPLQFVTTGLVRLMPASNDQ